MTIVSNIWQLIERKGIITAYVDFFDNLEPSRILSRSCFQGRIAKEIHDQIIERERKLVDQEVVSTLEDQLATLYLTKDKVPIVEPQPEPPVP